MKMPSLQFYPADWRKDPGVQALGFFERGVWFELLCLMHESAERGVLLLNGLPMPDAALERALGLDNQTLNQTLSTLLTYGVASRRQEDGALYSRRMVRDEHLCQVRREAGKKGGNPRLLNQTPNQKPTTGDKQIPTPSSSSSTSFSTSVNTPPTPGVGAGEKVSAEGSKKKEAGPAAENYHADDSPASASHTGPAAAGADPRPEFRPDPEWAPQMRLVADQMAEYWKLTAAQQDARMRIGRFCRTLFEAGQGELLTRQFQAYRGFKTERDERSHGWRTFLGDESQAYANGAWNEKDWVAALAEARKTPQNGNNRLAGAAGNGSAGDSSRRHHIPARINYENDAA